MSDMNTPKKYTVRLDCLLDKDVFGDASSAELRVLLALVASGGTVESIEDLAEKSQATRPRCAAALALWEEEGIIFESLQPKIIEEFCERLTPDIIIEEPARTVAENLRDENLKGLIDECAEIMGKAALTTPEVKTICALVTQYGLSAEYIAILCQNMHKNTSKLTVTKLSNKAIKLADKGIDTVEQLEQYIIETEKMSPAAYEYCRALGIHRRLSERELEFFERWDKEFGFSVEIIKEAYSLTTINTSGTSFRYMDKILSSWHEAGCKTAEECRKRAESVPNSEKATPKRAKPRKDAPTPRYGDFDIEDAFKMALERSYKEEENHN